MDSTVLSICFLIFFPLDLVFTMAKTAFLNARKSRLNMLREETGIRVAPAIALLDNSRQLRTKLIVSHSLVRVLLFGCGLSLFLSIYELSWQTLSSGILITGIIIVLAETAVDSYVIQIPELWTLRLAGFTELALLLLSPLWALPLFVLRWMENQADDNPSAPEEELVALLEATHEDGGLEEDEADMIRSIFQLRDTTVREIMVPRIDMLTLSANTPIIGAIDKMLESGYSRVPVYEDSIDRTIGILYVKDLLRLLRSGQTEDNLAHIVRAPYFVPESKKVDDLLADMQRERIHIAMVVDEYGGVAGLVTLEDIVEELVGEIQDEYDKAEEEMYEEQDDGTIIFLARIDLDDFNEILEVDLPNDEADTLGGLIYSEIGKIPKGGEVVTIGDLKLTVEQVVGRRIRKVRVNRMHLSDEITNKESYDNSNERNAG